MQKVPIEIFKSNPKRPEPVFSGIAGFLKVEGDLYLSKDMGLLNQVVSVSGHCFMDNSNLSSLKGSPIAVGGGFYCYGNQLTSLEGCPQLVGGDFSCGHNKAEFTEKQVRSLCNVKGKIYV